MPSLKPGEKMCTSCQKPCSVDNFTTKNSMPDGKGHVCKNCNKAKLREWFQKKPKHPREIPAHRRPGRWVLRPCEHCGVEFNARQMHMHLPRCDKNLNRRKPQIEYHPMENMLDFAANSPERMERRRKHENLRKYGIGISDYDRMLREQNGKCAICGKPPSLKTRKERALAVDHDHRTGGVRGLLCIQCNHLLGNSDESFAVLLAAMDYLRSHQRIGLVS